MSEPPPSTPPPTPDDAGGPLDRRQELVVPLVRARGWRKLGGGREQAYIRLLGSEITFVHPGVLTGPLTLLGGLVECAAVDRGRTDRDGDHGRFAILHRIGPTQVVPREEGIMGWLWTSRHGSALPLLSESNDDVPNLALLFSKPLVEEEVLARFQPQWLQALADRSPLGRPTVFGLLATVESPWAAEEAFRRFGVLKPVTDREVAPTLRRHLPTDKPANPTFAVSYEHRAGTSVAPPGGG